MRGLLCWSGLLRVGIPGASARDLLLRSHWSLRWCSTAFYALLGAGGAESGAAWACCCKGAGSCWDLWKLLLDSCGSAAGAFAGSLCAAGLLCGLLLGLLGLDAACWSSGCLVVGICSGSCGVWLLGGWMLDTELLTRCFMLLLLGLAISAAALLWAEGAIHRLPGDIAYKHAVPLLGDFKSYTNAQANVWNTTERASLALCCSALD